MRSHLDPLAGRCTALTRLCLRGPGQEYVGDRYGWLKELEEQRYAEWARFIDSVRPTVKDLIFEQGRLPNTDAVMYGAWLVNFPQQDRRPMDLRFIDHILPVLAQGPWPCLEKMTVRGVFGAVRSQLQSKQRPSA